MFGKRVDGKRIKGLSPFRRIIPLLMKKRNESILYFDQELDLTDTFRFLRQYNKEVSNKDERLGLFHVFMAAVVRSFALRPQLNRFVSNYKYYQRKGITISFLAKKEMSDEGEETAIKSEFDLYDTLPMVKEKIDSGIKSLMAGEETENDKITRSVMRGPTILSRFMIMMARLLDRWNLVTKGMIAGDPMYSSAFVTNLGSIRVEAPFHHLFEWGNCSFFVAIGRLDKGITKDADGLNKVIRKVKITVSIDDRISDGYYLGNSLRLFQSLVSDPSLLMSKPDIADDLLQQHYM